VPHAACLRAPQRAREPAGAQRCARAGVRAVAAPPPWLRALQRVAPQVPGEMV